MGRPYEIRAQISVLNTSVLYGIDCPTKIGISKLRITGTKLSAPFDVTVYSRSLTPAAQPINLIGEDPHGSGKTVIEFFTAQGFAVGDKLVVADNVLPGGGDSGYNVTHTVTAIYASNLFLTDQTFTATGEGGNAAPALHLLGVTTAPATEPGAGYAVLVFDTPHGFLAGDVINVVGDTGPSTSVSAYDTPPHAMTVTQVLDPFTVVTDRAYVGAGAGGLVTLGIPKTQWPNYEVLSKTASVINGTSDNTYRYDEPHGYPYVCRDPNVNNMPQRKIYFLFDTEDEYCITITTLSDWYG